jgi:hypothetical protein
VRSKKGKDIADDHHQPQDLDTEKPVDPGGEQIGDRK